MKPFPLTLTLLTVALAAHAQSWTNLYNGPGNGEDSANAIGVDRNGNVFVLGGSDISGGTNLDYVTIKYSGAGVPLWTNRYGSPGNAYDFTRALAVDTNGNVFVTGTSMITDINGSCVNCAFATVAYSSIGLPLWTNRYNGPGDVYASAPALALDLNGNVFVTGSVGDGVNLDYATIAYSSAGVLLWERLYDGPGNASDNASALVVDVNGNVVVTGTSEGASGSFDFATIKYSNAGVPLWTNRYDGPGSGVDGGNALAVDTNGNVFVTGATDDGSGTNTDLVTIAYSTAGVPLWTNYYIGPGDPVLYGNALDVGLGVVVDNSGNVIVTGQSTGYEVDYVTIKYSNAGVPLWTNRYDGLGVDLVRSVAVDGKGNVFVTGITWGGCATVAYSSAGTPLWTNLYAGPEGGSNAGGQALAVDANDNLFIAGYWGGTGSGSDYLTIKYAAPPPPSLNIQKLGDNVVLSWTNATFGLQSAPTITGTFTNVPGATSPYTNPISGGQQFFRLKAD